MEQEDEILSRMAQEYSEFQDRASKGTIKRPRVSASGPNKRIKVDDDTTSSLQSIIADLETDVRLRDTRLKAAGEGLERERGRRYVLESKLAASEQREREANEVIRRMESKLAAAEQREREAYEVIRRIERQAREARAGLEAHVQELLRDKATKDEYVRVLIDHIRSSGQPKSEDDEVAIKQEGMLHGTYSSTYAYVHIVE